MRKLRFDSIRQESEQDCQKLLSLALASGCQVPEPSMNWKSPGSVSAFVNWYLRLWTTTSPCSHTEAEGEGQDCLKHALVCLLLPVMMRKSQVFLMDADLVRSILDAPLASLEGEGLRSPFPCVYVEPTTPVEWVTPGDRAVGFVYAEIDDGWIGGPASVERAYHVVLAQGREPGIKKMCQYYMKGLFAGVTDQQGVVVKGHEGSKKSASWYTAKLLAYLSSVIGLRDTDLRDDGQRSSPVVNPRAALPSHDLLRAAGGAG